MRQAVRVCAAVTVLLAPETAQAAPREVIQPLQLGAESIRFEHGDYLIDLPGRNAAVQVRPMPSDHGNISFVVAVLNTGSNPMNIDLANMRWDGASEPVRLLTRGEMVGKAEKRAGWSKFFTRFGGALAAAGQANQRDYVDVTAVTPYGLVTATASMPCGACQLAAANTLARTDAQVARIQGGLDQARDAYGEQMFQLTTLYPGRGYAGRVFLSRFKHVAMQDMRLTVTLGDEAFQFGFRFAPEGTPAPAYRIAAAPVAVSPMPQAIVSPAVMRPATLPVVPAPNLQVATFRPDAGARDRWQRLYGALVANGVPKRQARDMADEQVGAID